MQNIIIIPVVFALIVLVKNRSTQEKRTGKDSIKSLMNSYNNLYEANLAFKVKLMLTFPHKVHIINIVLHMKYIETTSCLSSSAG